MKEFVVLVLTGITAVAAAGIFYMIIKPDIDRITRGMSPSEADNYIAPACMEMCCVFFSTIYFSGQFYANRFGDHLSDVFLNEGSRKHMRILHFLAGGYILATEFYFKPKPHVFSWRVDVSILVGAWMILFAVFPRKRREEM
jgi:hypothetical protein